MDKKFEGYAIYGKSIVKGNMPFAVVSNNEVCRAIASYIPNQFKDCLIAIEDRRFRQHRGLDFRSISRALIKNIQAGKIVQGGSTITQQLARNLLNQNKKTIARKIKESIKAVSLERQFSKDEILNEYFNSVYYGKNLRGIRSAALYYFGKEIEALNHSEMLYLLAILRGPNFYLKRPNKALQRYNLLNGILSEKKLISNNRCRKNHTFKLDAVPNHLQTIKSLSIPYIINWSDNKHKRINSTIIPEVQSFARGFVNDSKFPSSIIILHRGKVIGFASAYGNDYPFTYKSNVGSTLKPFLYCYLRDRGISKYDTFFARGNNLDWTVREATLTNLYLNLQEALLCSNNNVFLNAATEIGLENCLQFLAQILQKNPGELSPASILGATKCGISLYELASIYSNFFSTNDLGDIKMECLSLLNKLFLEKIGLEIDNAFLKTGTTNSNKERFVILGDSELTFAYLRNDNMMINSITENSKGGTLLEHVSKSLGLFFRKFYKSTTKSYAWL